MPKQTMQAEEVIRGFNERCQSAMLATVEAGRPRIRPMAALAIEGNVIWMAACSQSDKMSQMAANPNVELCYLDAQRRHLRLAGQAELVDEAAMKERMWREHPILHEYFSSCDCPDYRLIKITVAQAMLMDNPQTGYQKLPV